MIKKSNKSKYFFKHNGLMKWINKIEYKSLSEQLLKGKYINNDSEEFNIMIDFLYKTLEYDPLNRLQIKDCLEHKLFDSIK